MGSSASSSRISAARACFLLPLLISLFSILPIAPADAYPSRRHTTQLGDVSPRAAAGCVSNEDHRYFCASPATAGRISMAGRAATRRAARAGLVVTTEQGTVIGSRPAGCPRAYCGCGLRKHLGLADVRLNLAANWARLFPREAAPRAGLAAVRRGHVMYIEASAGDGRWRVRDYNSGGGLSRIHTRDVRGYAFVNPHAGLRSAARTPSHDASAARLASQTVF